MGFVYHGSKEHGLKRLEPRKSTHGNYVYATPEKVLALIFSSRCGDDLTYSLGHFSTDRNGPWELVENIPGAFDKMFSNSSSIYSFSDETFKDINTGFEEVVSEVGVDVVKEEYCENVYELLLEQEKKGLVKIYRYPDKPETISKDGSNILDKWRFYKNRLNKEFRKEGFDRLVCLYPNLLDKINELAKEFNYDYHYEPNDLIEIFSNRIQHQLGNYKHELYIDSSYISICSAFPSLKPQIDVLYDNYKKSITQEDITQSMNQDLLKTKELLLKYIKVIIENYSKSDRERLLDIIDYDSQIIKFNPTDTITFVVQDGILLLPKNAYKVFPILKQHENYCIKPNNGRNVEDYLDTNTTYMEYINHIIESGMSEYDYFEESLLHEAMHICGSIGGTPLEEGINELKTRELAKKNNIKIAAYGYSKEVEIAKRLQQIVGKELMDELTFVPKEKRKEFLSTKTSNRVAELYESLSDRMIEESRDYYNSVLLVSDPFEKAKLYEGINYTKSYQVLDNYIYENSEPTYS